MFYSVLYKIVKIFFLDASDYYYYTRNNKIWVSLTLEKMLIKEIIWGIHIYLLEPFSNVK